MEPHRSSLPEPGNLYAFLMPLSRAQCLRNHRCDAIHRLVQHQVPRAADHEQVGTEQELCGATQRRRGQKGVACPDDHEDRSSPGGRQR